jgi:multiple sugar transport system ATP-binding protein
VRTAAADRGVAMVFQSYALYPHMTVRQNLSFGLENMRMKRAEIVERVDRAAKLLRIDPYLDRKPRQLSGGQRQRVAIGRAITRDPKIFLFDEPLSNLDAELRVIMRLEISRLHASLGNTMVYVTHDQVEAMTMADRIVVLRAGTIEQVGPPLELYNRPRNKFVAGFIGSPRMNFLPARIVRAGQGDFDIDCDGLGTVTLPREGRAISQGQFVSFGVRPEDLRPASANEPGWPLEVDVIEQHGSTTFLHCKAPSGEVLVQIPGQGMQREGEHVRVAPVPGQWHLFGADELRIAVGTA